MYCDSVLRITHYDVFIYVYIYIYRERERERDMVIPSASAVFRFAVLPFWRRARSVMFLEELWKTLAPRGHGRGALAAVPAEPQAPLYKIIHIYIYIYIHICIYIYIYIYMIVNILL